MTTGDLFFQSALLNAVVFIWLACIVSASRIFLGRFQKLSNTHILLSFLGPLAIGIAWLMPKPEAEHIKSTNKRIALLRSGAAIFVVSIFINLMFYQLFVAQAMSTPSSSELMLRSIAFFVISAGFIGGVVLSAIVVRLAFFEACWTACLFAVFSLMLSDWAEITFSYATSSTYFSALLLTLTTLLLIFLTLGGSVGFLFFGEGRLNSRFFYERFLGLRFLMTKQSSQAVSLITVISVIAVTIATSGMIVVLSVMNGFTSDLREKILGANAHLMVLKYGRDFVEYNQVIEQTKGIPSVIGASAFIVNEGMVSSNKNLSGAIITGIDLDHLQESGRLKYVGAQALTYIKNPETIPVVTPIKSGDSLAELPKDKTKNDLPGVILGKEMASDLHVMVGDIVNLISPVGEIGPTGPIPRAKPFRVAGFFASGMYDFDAKFAYIALADAQQFFNLGKAVTGIEYRVDDIEKTRAVAQEIEAIVGGYPFYTRDWMQMNRNMFSALQLEKIAMWIILGTLIFMASLLILVSLVMVVMEKGKEIAILKSMGATDVSIMKIFVTYGLFVGGIGAVLGGACGFIFCFLIEKIGIRLDPDVYYFSNLPVKFEVNEVFMVVSAAVLISFLATIPPSLFAARLKPVEGLRYE